MIRQFSKSHDERLSENFWLREFHCHCQNPKCESTYISEDLIEGLQALRDVVGALDILSGFRCAAHNIAIKGAPKSKHLLGIAADCESNLVSVAELNRVAKRTLGFSQGGIGIYKDFIHLDVRGTPARWDLSK